MSSTILSVGMSREQKRQKKSLLLRTNMEWKKRKANKRNKLYIGRWQIVWRKIKGRGTGKSKIGGGFQLWWPAGLGRPH